jgi:hypothetical protein
MWEVVVRVTLSVRILPVLKDRLVERARVERRSVGSTLEMLLEEALGAEPGWEASRSTQSAGVVPPAADAGVVPVPASSRRRFDRAGEVKPDWRVK